MNNVSEYLNIFDISNIPIKRNLQFLGKAPIVEQAPQILSKLFPQTAGTESNLEEIKKEQEKKDEEDRKEKEGSWKRMKLGFVFASNCISDKIYNYF